MFDREVDRHDIENIVAIYTKLLRDDTADVTMLGKDFDDYFCKAERKCAVLGVDIYGYSRFAAARQRLVPIVFSMLYDDCVDDLHAREPLLFRGPRPIFATSLCQPATVAFRF